MTVTCHLGYRVFGVPLPIIVYHDQSITLSHIAHRLTMQRVSHHLTTNHPSYPGHLAAINSMAPSWESNQTKWRFSCFEQHVADAFASDERGFLSGALSEQRSRATIERDCTWRAHPDGRKATPQTSFRVPHSLFPYSRNTATRPATPAGIIAWYS